MYVVMMLCVYMMNIQLYVQARFTWSGSKLLRHLVQAAVVYLAVYVGMTRISDYKHHWSDVLAGAVLGSLVACLTVSRLSYADNVTVAHG